jgi:cell division protein FtsN
MPVPERRRTPRITLERLAYINIEPNNGGIVLNVSAEGLCFHSIASVERNGKVRFSLLENSHRIEAEGELAWMDEVQKVGGLRFTQLSAEAREQVHNWVTQPSTDFDDDAPATWPVGSGVRFPSLADRWAKSGAGPALAPSPSQASPGDAKPRILSGFSGGLATGLLLSVLIASGFLFHSYRHQLGESLIQLGVRLSARPSSPGQALPQAPAAALPHSGSSQVSSAAPVEVSGAGIQTEKPASQMREPAAGAQSQKSRPEGLAVKASITVPRTSRSSSAVEPLPLPPSELSFVNRTGAPLAQLLAQTHSPGLPQLEVVTAPGQSAETEPPAPMFFEVGKFKQQRRAREVNDQLAQLHFPTSITQKGSLFGSSYYVLVGPYDDPDTANHAHKGLSSNGFKPRAFERGSRNFTLSSGVTLNGTEMTGDFVISWESYIPDAKVKFSQNDSFVTSADGKWVDRGVRTERNAFVYQKRTDGAHVLLEIRFEGMSKVLVFSKPS